MKAVDVFTGENAHMHIHKFFQEVGQGHLREGRSKELLTILLAIPCPLYFNERSHKRRIV